MSLVSKFNETNNIFDLSQEELCKADGIDQKSANSIKKTNFDYGKRIVDHTFTSKLEILSFWDTDYPQLLKIIYEPPVFLYYKGVKLRSKEDSVAIVDTRSITQYRKFVTKLFAD